MKTDLERAREALENDLDIKHVTFLLIEHAEKEGSRHSIRMLWLLVGVVAGALVHWAAGVAS